MKINNVNMQVPNDILINSANNRKKGIMAKGTGLDLNSRNNNHIASIIEQKQEMEKRLDEMKDNQRKHILDLENQISDIQTQISGVKNQIGEINK